MASGKFLDIKTDADYIALRRRMSRLRVQNHKTADNDEDEEDDLSDDMLKDLIKYWKKNNLDIAKRFIQQRKEKRAKEKRSNPTPKPGGRRKSIEFEDVDVTKHGLRLKSHDPLHLHKETTHRIAETPDCIGSDECLSVRRPLKSANEQKMSMISHRAASKTDMSKSEEKIIKSKIGSLSKPTSRCSTPNGFRSRTNSGSTDFKKKSSIQTGRPKSSASVKSGRPKSSASVSSHKQGASETFRQRSYSNSSRSPPASRKVANKTDVSKQMPIISVSNQ